MGLQTIVTGVIVLAAFVYVARMFGRMVRGKGGCGCGEKSCPKADR